MQIRTSFIRDNTLSAEARMLAMIYASFANRKGQVRPQAKLLRRITGFGCNKLLRIRKELAAKGILTRRQLKGRTGRFGAAVYTVTDTHFRFDEERK
jgi:hypothetical protein